MLAQPYRGGPTDPVEVLTQNCLICFKSLKPILMNQSSISTSGKRPTFWLYKASLDILYISSLEMILSLPIIVSVAGNPGSLCWEAGSCIADMSAGSDEAGARAVAEGTETTSGKWFQFFQLQGQSLGTSGVSLWWL